MGVAKVIEVHLLDFLDELLRRRPAWTWGIDGILLSAFRWSRSESPSPTSPRRAPRCHPPRWWCLREARRVDPECTDCLLNPERGEE